MSAAVSIEILAPVIDLSDDDDDDDNTSINDDQSRSMRTRRSGLHTVLDLHPLVRLHE
jgi:hypothetical protein